MAFPSRPWVSSITELPMKRRIELVGIDIVGQALGGVKGAG